MKKLMLIYFTTLLTLNMHGQSCYNKEIQIEYTNGFEVFNICETTPKITFKEENEYYWYTEFSKIKSTKGGCGGSLLNGNYKFYDEEGNLRIDKNYTLGLEDGNEVRWDSLGNIISKTTFEKGNIIYCKFLNEKDYWNEFNGAMFAEGTVRKVYKKNGTIISEEKILAGNKWGKQHVKIYYEYPVGQLKEEYTNHIFGGDYFSGLYTSYYENGKIKIEGQFYEGNFTNIQVGEWKWYNEDGSLSQKETYKAEVTNWENGAAKTIGGYIYDTENGEWLRIGEWKWLDEIGNTLDTKHYQWGEEITE